MSSKPIPPITFHHGAHEPTHLGGHPEDVTRAVVDVAPYRGAHDPMLETIVEASGVPRAIPAAVGVWYASME